MERKLFYVNLKSFLKELVVVFPESDDELQIITTSINLAIVDDEDNEIIDTFYKTLSPVAVEIETRDLSIFDKVKWDQSSHQYSLFRKLKTQWKTFSENNKKVIWDYITILYGLSLKFNCH